jgi:NADH dehydrogenase FAD-containing subunit
MRNYTYSRLSKIQLTTTGASHPNTDFVNSLGTDVLTSAGFVKVKPTLQLLNHPNIFAAGDIIEWKEQKQAMKSGRAHAPIVVKNVMSYIKGSKMKNYSTAFEAVILTNGKVCSTIIFHSASLLI